MEAVSITTRRTAFYYSPVQCKSDKPGVEESDGPQLKKQPKHAGEANVEKGANKQYGIGGIYKNFHVQIWAIQGAKLSWQLFLKHQRHILAGAKSFQACDAVIRITNGGRKKVDLWRVPEGTIPVKYL